MLMRSTAVPRGSLARDQNPTWRTTLRWLHAGDRCKPRPRALRLRSRSSQFARLLPFLSHFLNACIDSIESSRKVCMILFVRHFHFGVMASILFPFVSLMRTAVAFLAGLAAASAFAPTSVSYTHLTLPTNREV